MSNTITPRHPELGSNPEPRLTYRPAEAARLLGIGRSTLYLYVQKGVLRTTRLGGCTLILAEDLRALITRNGEAR